MGRGLLSLLALGLLLPVSARAQVTLTETQALAQLSPNSPRIRALRAQIDLARADALAASRLPNPRVTLSRESVSEVTEHYLLVAQPLPITGRRALDRKAADARVAATEARVAELEHQARAELRLTFAALRERQRREEELTGVLRSLRELAELLAKREQAGDAAGFDRLRAEREVLDLDADLTTARVERVEAQAALAAFFSPTPDPLTIRVATDSAPSPDVPDAETLIARAEQDRPDVQARLHDVDAARAALRAATRRHVPEPEVVAGLKTSDAAGGDRGSVFSVLATVPLFDRSQPEQARAQAQERQAQAELDVLRAQLRTEIIAARARVLERRRAASAYQSQAVTRADDLQRIARVSYDAGERSILELLDTYQSAAQARLRQATLDAEVTRAEVDLELATGWEIVR